MKFTSEKLKPAVLALTSLLIVACGSQDEIVNPEDRLCGGGSGFGLSVLGRAEPVEVCVADEDVSTFFSSGSGRYEITARMTGADGTLFDVQLSFAHHPNFPIGLNLTTSLAAATTDPLGVWLFYQEIPQQGPGVESGTILSGIFTLSISGGDVVTGTLSGITMEMVHRLNQEVVGTREMPEGFFSLLVE